MRKILVTLALLAGAFYTLFAVPAYPGKIKVVQPDGSVITIQIHGDEFFSYVTDERGQVVAQDAAGFYRPAQMPSAEQQEEAARMRRAAAQMRAQAAQAQSLTHGRHKIPVVLVNFSDKEFVVNDPATAFSNMLNQEGYSANGGTGSVRDYYYENSHGEYEPVFDVFGPVTVSNTSEYYAYNKTERAHEALKEACELLNAEIDFRQYDSDGDNYVDMILMYYAGHNQAEGGGETTIWPHQSERTIGTFDGKKVRRYFCTSELQKGNGVMLMCGIGTTTHEFGHSLGLPDFYDTNGKENGEAGALYYFSLMCRGSYNNEGRTPPYLNSEERKMLGWMDDQIEIQSPGPLMLTSIQDGVAYKTPTTMDGEYFVYECRTSKGWDSALPGGPGLLVYHVDKSERETLNPDSWWSYLYTPNQLWESWGSTNAVNAFGSHPCFYLIPAANQSSLEYKGNEADIPFPGRRKVTKYTPVDWQGEQGDFRFTDIAFDGTQITMTAHLTTVAGVRGFVRNTAAKPVRGATVSIYRNSAASAPARGMLRSRSQALGKPLMSVTTDVDGSYALEDVSLADDSFTLLVTCDGYVEEEASVEIGRRVITQDFYIRKVGESTESTFIKYDPEGGSFAGIGFGDASKNHAAGIHLSAEETVAYVGKQIKLISFQPYGDESSTVESAYVFIESAGKRVFTQTVDNVRFDAMNTVSVVAQEFVIPKNADLYIGYALVGCNEPYPLLAQACEEDNAGYMATFRQKTANDWSLMKSNATYYTPVLSASVGEPVEAELGFNYIANPGNGSYKAGERFELSLVRYEDDAPSTVAWKFDGQTVRSDSVSLTAGSHTVEAHLTYPDGSAEVIRLVINAE